MIKLYQFYDLIQRTANVTLADAKLEKTFYDGTMKEIPDGFDDCEVTDFCVSNDGDFLFKINK